MMQLHYHNDVIFSVLLIYYLLHSSCKKTNRLKKAMTVPRYDYNVQVAHGIPGPPRREALMLIPKFCPRCNGDVVLLRDESGTFGVCLQCLCYRRLPEAVVTTQQT
jgi:hypothetical protein